MASPMLFWSRDDSTVLATAMAIFSSLRADLFPVPGAGPEQERSIETWDLKESGTRPTLIAFGRIHVDVGRHRLVFGPTSHLARRINAAVTAAALSLVGISPFLVDHVTGGESEAIAPRALDNCHGTSISIGTINARANESVPEFICKYPFRRPSCGAIGQHHVDFRTVSEHRENW